LKRPIEILAMRLAVGPNLPLKGAGSRPERAGDIDRGDIRFKKQRLPCIAHAQFAQRGG
jgi:hypothetical protein